MLPSGTENTSPSPPDGPHGQTQPDRSDPEGIKAREAGTAIRRYTAGSLSRAASQRIKRRYGCARPPAVTTRPPLGERANAVTTRSISDASRILTGLTSKPTDGAAVWITPNWARPEAITVFRRTATRVTRGATCLSNSSHFPLRPYSFA